MAAGVFGYMGYDTVRLVEHLPSDNPDPIGTPDAIDISSTMFINIRSSASFVVCSTSLPGIAISLSLFSGNRSSSTVPAAPSSRAHGVD